MKLFFITPNFSLFLSFIFCVLFSTQIVSAQTTDASPLLSAVLDNDQVVLNWTNVGEDEIDYFTLERSLNGRQWEILVQMESVENEEQDFQYQTTDIEPYEGTSFYRLVQTNYEGQKTISSNVEMNFEVSMDAFFMSQQKAVDRRRKNH